MLDPQKDFGVNRLRACKPAPQAPSDRREQKERVGADDEQRRKVNEVLRIKNQRPDIKASGTEVKQNQLAPVPVQPCKTVERQLRHPDQGEAPVGEPTCHCTGVDPILGAVQRHHLHGGVSGVALRSDCHRK